MTLTYVYQSTGVVQRTSRLRSRYISSARHFEITPRLAQRFFKMLFDENFTRSNKNKELYNRGIRPC